ISTIASPAPGATAWTMRFSTPGSCRKCWPKRLRVLNGCVSGASPVFEAQLDIGPVAQLAQPVLKRFVRLALLEREPGLHAAALLRQPGRAALQNLDQMPAERRF